MPRLPRPPEASARTPTPGTSVTTLELFFDLVFVFAVTRLTDLVLHADTLGYLTAGLVLFVTWWMYDGYAWLTNHVAPTQWSVRLPILVGMTCFLVMAVASGDPYGAGRWPFALAYLVVILVHAATFSRATVGGGGRAIWRVLPFNAGAALALVAAALLPESLRVWGWVAAVVIILGQVASGSGRNDFVIRAEHFGERHHLLVIVALGETVVEIGVGAEDGIDDPLRLLALVLCVATIAALWWLYFGGEDEEGTEAFGRLPDRSTGTEALIAYGFTHMLLIAGLILVAAGLHEVVHDPLHHLDLRIAVTLAAGVATYCLGQALYERRLGLGSGVVLLGAGVFALATSVLGFGVGALVELVALLLLLVAICLVRGRGRPDRAPGPGRIEPV